jgi:hypothetical protein
VTSLQSLWMRAPHLAFVDDGDRVVVLDLTHPGRPPLLLSSTACALWRLLPGPQGPGAASEALADNHYLNGPDFDSVLEQLEAAGLAVSTG